MKRVLLVSIALFALLTRINRLNAQCIIDQSSISVTDIVAASAPNGTCDVTFTLSFDLSGNSGNKWSFIHIWKSDIAPTLNWNSNPKPKPDLSYLTSNNSKPLLATIAIDYSSTNGTALPRSYYPYDINVLPFYSDELIINKSSINGVEHFEIKNIKINVTECSEALNLKADVWSAQDDNGKQIACGVSGLTFTANDPIVRAMNMGCGSTRQITTTFITTIQRDITFGLYKDVAPFGVFTLEDYTEPNKLLGPLTTTTTLHSETGDYRSSEISSYLVNNGEKFDVWVVASADGVSNLSTDLAVNSCSPLPVAFFNFYAQRNREKVALNWATASEQNNRGFNVQRNTRGVWETIAFVFSQADGGNSDELISYEFKDPNSEKGVSQYRIQQVDMDGKASYSAIRSVKGLEQAGTHTVVYPNPSSDGKVSVVFEDQGAKAVTVSDMSGRVIRQFRNVLNNVQIEGLESGMYSIQITDLSSAVSSTEKVIIKMR